jgi:iron complex outermembrane receptor protein
MPKIVSRILFASTILTGATPLYATAAFAQSAAQPTASANGGEEIVVTARSRAEKLKDVPVSLTALSGATLDRLDLSSIADIQNFAPGLTYAPQGVANFPGRLANRSIMFRGLNLINNFTIFAAGTSFLDGMPLLGGELPVGVDLARVEVLRGPQNVTFGRSAMAGAISYVSKDPVSYWQGDIEAKAATYDTTEIKGSLSGPVVADQLFIGIAGDTSRLGGYDNNPGNAGQILGKQTSDSVSTHFEWRPIEGLRIKGFGTYYQNDDGPADEATIKYSQTNCKLSTATAAVNRFYCGTIPQYNQIPNGLWQNTKINAAMAANLWDPENVAPNEFHTGFGVQRHAMSGNLLVSYDIGDFATVESRTSAEHDDSIGSADGTLAPIPTSLVGLPFLATNYNLYRSSSLTDNVQDFSQELRVNSATEQRLRWTAGGNYVRGSDVQVAHVVTQSSTAAPTATDSYINQVYARTFGIYGGLYYDILDNLTLSAEGRYQWDKRNTPPIPEAIFKSFSPRAALEWKVTPDVSAYASYAKGSRPGGFNGILTQTSVYTPAVLAQIASVLGPINLAYKEETLKTWEAGVKGDAFNNRINFNIDGYYGKLENQQVRNVTSVPLLVAQGTATVSLTNNIGATDIWGVEAEGGVRITDQLTLTGTFAWNHTKIVNYYCTACVAYTGSTASALGHNLGVAPEYTASLQADYRDQLLQTDWDWYAHADYIYRGGENLTNFSDEQTNARNILNLRLGVDNGSFTIEGFIENVTNDRNLDSPVVGVDTLFTGAATPTPQIVFNLPPPRVFGGRVKYHFGAPHEAAATAASYTPPPVQAVAPAKAPRSYLVFFDFNKSDLTSQAVSIVDTAAKNAGPAKVTQIEVTGHTDTVGSDAYNMRLSRRRAEAVAKQLEKDGIPSSEIAIFAKGKKDLLVPTADGVREPQNRRVQIMYEGGANS